MTQISDVMTRGVRWLSPHDSIRRAAETMQELDIGVVPVCEGDRLIGVVTDRDLVVRGLALGRSVDDTPLREVMSNDPQSCFEDQALDEVLEQMRDARIRRVPVLDRQQQLVGMLSLGDVAVRADGDGAGIVLQEVSEPAQSSADGDDGAAGDGATSGGAAAPDGGGVGDGADANDGAVSGAARVGGGADSASDPGRWANRGVEPRVAPKTTWVLVADEAIARILQLPEDGGDLESLEALTDPSAHAREGDFQRDAAGRRSGSATHRDSPNTAHRLRASANVTSSAGEDQQHLEAQSFAKRVAQHLSVALKQKRFDELRVVAAPRFLGHLRKELDAHVSATIADELNKDLIHEENSAITRRLFPERVDDGTAAV